MIRVSLASIRAVGVSCALVALASLSLPAVAANGDKAWNRGCADAKAGSYDRAHHNESYEAGWQACKKQPAQTGNVGRDYDRGCADAKAGSYDRAHHNEAYESGWQACKSQAAPKAAATGAPSKQEQACLAAVSREANNGQVKVLSSEFSQANSVVMIGVGPQHAPWRCLVSNSGAVQEVSYAGGEG